MITTNLLLCVIVCVLMTERVTYVINNSGHFSHWPALPTLMIISGKAIPTHSTHWGIHRSRESQVNSCISSKSLNRIAVKLFNVTLSCLVYSSDQIFSPLAHISLPSYKACVSWVSEVEWHSGESLHDAAKASFFNELMLMIQFTERRCSVHHYWEISSSDSTCRMKRCNKFGCVWRHVSFPSIRGLTMFSFDSSCRGGLCS